MNEEPEVQEVPKPQETAQPEVTAAEVEDARHQGAVDAISESAKHDYLTGGSMSTNVVAPDRWPDRHEIMQWAYIIDFGLDDFKDAVSAEPKSHAFVPEGKIAGLVELERSGKNRTQYVQALLDRLDVESVYDVTDAGPDYSNDVTPMTKHK